MVEEPPAECTASPALEAAAEPTDLPSVSQISLSEGNARFTNTTHSWFARETTHAAQDRLTSSLISHQYGGGSATWRDCSIPIMRSIRKTSSLSSSEPEPYTKFGVTQKWTRRSFTDID